MGYFDEALGIGGEIARTAQEGITLFLHAALC